MVDAPERIYASPSVVSNGIPDWDDGEWYQFNENLPFEAAFVRADIHDAVVAERDAALARVEALEDALGNLLDAITAEDRFRDRALTITGSTANLKWLLETEDDARITLAHP